MAQTLVSVVLNIVAAFVLVSVFVLLSGNFLLTKDVASLKKKLVEERVGIDSLRARITLLEIAVREYSQQSMSTIHQLTQGSQLSGQDHRLTTPLPREGRLHVSRVSDDALPLITLGGVRLKNADLISEIIKTREAVAALVALHSGVYADADNDAAHGTNDRPSRRIVVDDRE